MKRKDANYVQCSLQKGNTHHMAWIPEQFAVVNKFIKIKNENDTWDDGWQVTYASENKLGAEAANQASQMYKKTRKASDI